MNNTIINIYGSERSVEAPFTAAMLSKHFGNGVKILDVGGIPTHTPSHNEIMEAIKAIPEAVYEVSDFRGGKYRGDFVTMPIKETFDCVMFISSLEHFPQCTEGDRIFREGEDRRGFEKALSILEKNGKIILTVPFGKYRWQDYHQNYNMEALLALTSGSTIVDSYCYSLVDIVEPSEWIITDPNEMEDILYTDKCFGVGCFVLEKN